MDDVWQVCEALSQLARCPVEQDTVLSTEAVTAKRFAASVSIRLMTAPCLPVSMRKTGAVGRSSLTCWARPVPVGHRARREKRKQRQQTPRPRPAADCL
jgi:hypothetical protein